jgi:hypothetical protein
MLNRSKQLIENFEEYLDYSPTKSFRQLLVTLSPHLASSIKNTYEVNELHLDVAKKKKGTVEELVCSFRELLRYIDDNSENALFKKPKERKYNVSMDIELTALQSGEDLMPSELSFRKFANFVYPHLNEAARALFSDSFLFTQFVSVIKGSPKSLDSPNGCLSLEEYVSLAKHRSSMINENDRVIVYEAFKRYEKLKASRNEMDISDITFHIYKELCKQNRNTEKLLVDCVYIDEVQLFHLIEH